MERKWFLSFSEMEMRKKGILKKYTKEGGREVRGGRWEVLTEDEFSKVVYIEAESIQKESRVGP